MKFNILIFVTVCCSWQSCLSFLLLVPPTSRLDRRQKLYSCNTAGLCQLSAKDKQRNNFIQTLKAVPIFHPADGVAVVVSSVYWDNLRGKFLILLGVQLVLIVVGMAFLGTIANQLPNFLSSMVREDSNKTNTNDTLAVNASSRVSSKSQPNIDPWIMVPNNLPKLVICLMIDSIGALSELIPFGGEVADIVWAPIAATALRSLYGGSNVVFVLELLEEILPFTDIIPLATLCWFIETFYGNSDLAKLLQIGSFSTTRVPFLFSRRLRNDNDSE